MRDISTVGHLNLLQDTHEHKVKHLFEESLRWIELLVEILNLHVSQCQDWWCRRISKTEWVHVLLLGEHESRQQF